MNKIKRTKEIGWCLEKIKTEKPLSKLAKRQKLISKLKKLETKGGHNNRHQGNP